MKKVLVLLLAILMLALTLTACAGGKKEEAPPAATASPVDVRVAALKGPTAMGMVKFMDDADSGKLEDNNYKFEITAAIDEVTTKVVQGEIDIAAVPANLSSVLYNKTEGGVDVLAINVLGVLYIVEKGDSVNSVADLKGKTIYASGKGATPEFALNYILKGNGIDPEKDVTIEWKSEHAECVAALENSADGVAMLPQPFVTTAQVQDSTIRTAIDLNEAWNGLQANEKEPSALVVGTLIIRKEFLDANPDAVKAFLDHYKESVDFVDSNLDEASALVGKYDIVPEAVAKKAIPKCNISFIEGAELKTKLSGYLAVLYDQNPQSVGGALPGDDFYYSR
ncbi:MAG: ABC transporter substrate-binding protein [Clostridiales Family XIII bacterium]|jgi:NitT/TauT family transport system substrate-binding protein|nr:ABC transporter substrate-binding protein [Clostridiales Family XIII bacterium]